jgi:hypothetical protein
VIGVVRLLCVYSFIMWTSVGKNSVTFTFLFLWSHLRKHDWNYSMVSPWTEWCPNFSSP